MGKFKFIWDNVRLTIGSDSGYKALTSTVDLFLCHALTKPNGHLAGSGVARAIVQGVLLNEICAAG
jgi:hypothetical protein